MSNVKIEESWKAALKQEFDQPYFQALASVLKKEKAEGKIIYPPGALIFNAFNTTPFEQVKVVILGQDPYHNPNEAMGLSFSVPKGVRVPPSLRNIYKELNSDIGFEIPTHGDLTAWAEQGVFLLNAMLTVRKNQARSHQKIGWQNFTDAVIRTLSEQREHLVFMLWGGFAKKKNVLIDNSKHLILEAAHPSPLAGGAYFGSKHFSQANAYLESKGQKTINWQVQSAKCKVQSAKCKVQSAKCKVQSAKCKVQSAKCKVQSAKCKVQSAKCKVQSAKCKVYNAKIKYLLFVTVLCHCHHCSLLSDNNRLLLQIRPPMLLILLPLNHIIQMGYCQLMESQIARYLKYLVN